MNPLKAQDAVYSQFMFNQLIFSPSFAGNIPYPRFTSGYRNQWAGLNNAFVSYYASYDQFVKKMNGGIGVGLNRDIQANGIVSSTSFNLTYNYFIKYNDFIIVPGLQSGICQLSNSNSSLQLPDQNPFQTSTTSENLMNQSRIFPDFSFGTTLLLPSNIQLNFSARHINFLQTKSNDISYSQMPTNFNLQILGEFTSKNNNRPIERITYYPGILISAQKSNNYLQLGTNLKYSGLIGGLWLRNSSTLEMNTYIFLVGYTIQALSIVYNYDLWIPKTSQQFAIFGSHEISLIYLFQYNDPKKKMKQVKCSKLN